MSTTGNTAVLLQFIFRGECALSKSCKGPSRSPSVDSNEPRTWIPGRQRWGQQICESRSRGMQIAQYKKSHSFPTKTETSRTHNSSFQINCKNEPQYSMHIFSLTRVTPCFLSTSGHLVAPLALPTRPSSHTLRSKTYYLQRTWFGRQVQALTLLIRSRRKKPGIGPWEREACPARARFRGNVDLLAGR